MCYARLDEPVYHSLVIRSGLLVFHEVTRGPFVREETVFADWSPDRNNLEPVSRFMVELEGKLRAFAR